VYNFEPSIFHSIDCVDVRKIYIIETTITIVIVTGILGAHLARQQGFSIIMKIQENLAKGIMPTTEYEAWGCN